MRFVMVGLIHSEIMLLGGPLHWFFEGKGRKMRVLWIGLVGVQAQNHWVILLLVRRTSLEHFRGIEEVDATMENFDSRNVENCVHWRTLLLFRLFMKCQAYVVSWLELYLIVVLEGHYCLV